VRVIGAGETKNGMKTLLKAVTVAAGLAAFSGAARAADLTVFTGGSMAEPLRVAAGDFTKATGAKVIFVMGTTGVITGKVRAGEPADVVVISAEGLAALQKDGLIGPAPPVPLARAIIGAAVKKGAPRPDISTPDKFRAALQAATTVAYPDPGQGATAGVFLAGLFDRLGLGPAVAAKARLKANGKETAAAVASGEATLGLTFISELKPDPGVEVVGALPAAIQSPILYAAAVSARPADPAQARAFIAFVTSPGERARLVAAGVEPVAP
jgi:molybdate transport system substrate-binding protein